MAKMLTNLFEEYSKGSNTFGSINNAAFTEYMSEINQSSSAEWAAAFAFVFFGDPALSLLPQNDDSITVPEMSVNPIPDVLGGGINEPRYFFSASDSITLDFTATTNSSVINQKLFAIDDVHPTSSVDFLNESVSNSSPFDYSLTLLEENLYMVSYETSDFKETRLYFTAEEIPNIFPEASIMLEAQNQNQGNYDLLWTASSDEDGYVSHYELLEGKNPYYTTDECNSPDNWEMDSFLMSSNGAPGHSSPTCFWSGTGDNYTSTIISKYPYFVEEGDSLTFNIFHQIEEVLDMGYVEVTTDGENYQIIDQFTGNIINWEYKAYDLSSYVGEMISIRFRYQTDESMSQYGMFLDDINPVMCFESIRLIENIPDTTYYINNNFGGIYKYAVRAYDNYGDVNRWSNFINVSVNEGISNTIDKNHFSVFPNPAKSFVQIELSKNSGITIYNILGEKLYFAEHKAGSSSIDLADFPSGYYIVKMQSGSDYSVKKIIIEQ